MASVLKVDKLDPQSGTALEIGTSGNTITIPSGATIVNSGTATGFGGDNTPAFAVYSVAAQSIATATYTKVVLDSEFYDTDSAFASDKFTVPVGGAGKYFFSYKSAIPGIDDEEEFAVLLYKNGSTDDHAKAQFYSPTTDKPVWANATYAFSLAEADYIEMFVYHSEGGSQNLRIENTYFSGFKLIE